MIVCDNLAFAADHVIRRKHTVRAKRELPALLSDIIIPLKEQQQSQNTRLLTYKEAMLDESQVDHAIMQMYRKEVIGVQAIQNVLRA